MSVTPAQRPKGAKITQEEFEYTAQAYSDFKNVYTALVVDHLCPQKGGSIELLVPQAELNFRLNKIWEKLQLDDPDNDCSYSYRSMFRDFHRAFPDFGPILVEYAHVLLGSFTQAEAQQTLLWILKLLARTMKMTSGYGIRLLRTQYTGIRIQQLFNVVAEKRDVLSLHYQEIEKAWQGALHLLREEGLLYEIPNWNVGEFRATLLKFLNASGRARQLGAIQKAAQNVGGEFEDEVSRSLTNLGIHFTHYAVDATGYEYWSGSEKLPPVEQRSWESLDFVLHLNRNAKYNVHPTLYHLFAHLLTGCESVDVELEVKKSKKILSRSQQLTCENRRRQKRHFLHLWGNNIQCISCTDFPNTFEWPLLSSRSRPTCRYFAAGRCTRGKECNFAHV